MNYCSGVSFEIKYPITDPEAVELDLAYNMPLQGIDIYDANDPFFNDICYPFTSEEGKDVSLEDRREYYYKNVTFCEDDCEYNGIDYLTKEAICECNIKTNFITEALNNSVTGEFLEIIQSAKVEIFRCYKNVFNNELVNNVGCWIMFAFFICEFIFFVIYLFKGITSIQIDLLQFMPPVPAPPLDNDSNQITNKEEKKIFSDQSRHISSIKKMSEKVHLISTQ